MDDDLAVDELQEASRVDLAAVNMALHAIGQGMAPVPLYFVGAGLPTLPAVLADASSYAERMYRFYKLDLLDDEETTKAYVLPTDEVGLSWDDDALQEAVAVAAGYPYFIQQCGFSICEQVEQGAITLSEVVDGIGLARAELDGGLYRSRWDRATPAGKEMLRAMSVDGDALSKMTALAERMGREVNALYPLRDRLITDGLIYSPERGYVAFTVPGMAGFVERCDR